ncbi:MAG TPA: S8 family serine peptidase [Thermoanaerobaculia bacterium]|nr:S8 family serine peptidase [Thermoanaerobaculia bacterium]
MKRLLVVAVLILVPFALLADGSMHRYIVATKGPAAMGRGPALRNVVDAPESRNVMEFQVVDAFAVDLTEDEAAAVAKQPGVRYVSIEKERHTFGMRVRALAGAPRLTDANDIRNLNGQTVPYGLNLIHAPSVWPAGRGANINVAVMDTGIDTGHPDLPTGYAGGFNFYSATDPPIDDVDHGTHVSGTVAAADNNIGVVGVAPAVKIWAVKVLHLVNGTGSGSSVSIVAGINFVVAKKAEVGGNWIMTLSLGSAAPDPTEQAAFQKAIDAGILVIASAGNHDPANPGDPQAPNAVSFPAAYPGVMAVAAVDSTSTLAAFSNQGPEVAISGPGVNVLSTVPRGTGFLNYVSDGTSFLNSLAMDGSPKGSVTGHFVDCKQGHIGEFPAEVSGKIALIQRGDITFNAKATNAQTAGATAVVIYNNLAAADHPGPTDLISGTLLSATVTTFSGPLTTGISANDGQKLLANPTDTVTVNATADDYDYFSGTSMATPHVAAAAALVWSLAPQLTASQVKQALIQTAVDLGTPGPDTSYGAGLVDALAAAKLAAPGAFTTGPPSGRRILKRP